MGIPSVSILGSRQSPDGRNQRLFRLPNHMYQGAHRRGRQSMSRRMRWDLAIIRMVRRGAHSWSHHLWWVSRLVCRGSTAYRGQPFTNDLCQRPLLGCPLRMVWLGRKPHRISRDGHDLDGRCHMDRFQGRTK